MYYTCTGYTCDSRDSRDSRDSCDSRDATFQFQYCRPYAQHMCNIIKDFIALLVI